MTQAQLERRVARATGESLHTICSRGFSLADPVLVAYDPEPDLATDDIPQIIDWDERDAQRVGVFPARQRKRLVAA